MTGVQTCALPISWGARTEQLDHSARPSSDVDQPAERTIPERRANRALDLAFGDVERSDLIPNIGMAGEIAVGSLGALGTDRFSACGIGAEQGLRRRVGPTIDQREQRLNPLSLRKRQEDPAPLLPALENTDVGKDLQVSGHAWLALAEDLGKLTNGQLHQPQKRDDSQPGWIGKRLESIGKRQSHAHEIRI